MGDGTKDHETPLPNQAIMQLKEWKETTTKIAIQHDGSTEPGSK
jgi:hypothetical protein